MSGRSLLSMFLPRSATKRFVFKYNEGDPGGFSGLDASEALSGTALIAEALLQKVTVCVLLSLFPPLQKC